MKYLRRLGVLAIGTTLVGATALAGAGVAGAQALGEPWDLRLGSPSSVAVQRVDGQIELSYSNESGRPLTCEVWIGNGDAVAVMYDFYRTSDYRIGESETLPEPPLEVQLRLAAALEAGELAVDTVDVEAGATGPVTFSPGFEPPSSTDFVPEATVACGGDPVPDPEDDSAFWNTYFEMETTVAGGGGGGGAGGPLSSLENLIPAFGS